MKYGKLCIMLIMSLMFLTIISTVSADELTEVSNYAELSSNLTAGNNVILKNDISDGNFGNGITINKNVIVDGDGFCIDAHQTGRIFQISNSATLTLINITLKNGKTTGDGGAITASNNLNLICENNVVFYNNTATVGGAIGAKYIDIKCTNGNVTFNNNHATNYGGAIGLQKITSPVGSLVFNTNGTILFINNIANEKGGAIGISKEVYKAIKNITCNDILFKNNTAKQGGAIYGNTLYITSNNIEFSDNEATTDSGGAISTNNVIFNSTKSVLINNNKGYYYGAVYGSIIDITADYIEFSNNEARVNNGGGIRASTVNFNKAKSVLINNNTAKSGGAINADIVNIANAVFIKNNAESGSTIYAKEIILKNSTIKTESNNSPLYITGKAYFNNNTFTLTNKTIAPITFTGTNINSNVIALVFNNNTEYAKVGSQTQINVTFFDDNNNIIAILNNNLASVTLNNTNKGNLINNGLKSYINYNPDTKGVFLVSVSSSGLSNLTVKTALLIVNSDIDLIVSNLTTYFKSGDKLIAYLVDPTGKGIANKTITFTINGEKYNRTTDNNGKASMDINLAHGIYPVTVSYENLRKTVTVTVYPTVYGKDIVKLYLNSTQYYAYFCNSKGEALANTNVTFNINGVMYTRTTNASGIAKLNINLNPGTYTLTAINPTNGEQWSNNITVLSTIQADDVTKMFHNGTQYKARFTDFEGNPLINTEVLFNIHGVMYHKITDSNGYATLDITLYTGNYIITAYNLKTGESKSNNIEVKPILVGKDLTKTYSSKDQYEVTAYNNQGQLLPNANITINIHGVFYHIITDNTGVAKLDINLNPGEYIATAYYNDFATSNKIKILEA